LVMGSFLEPPAAILILTPLLLPIVQAIGISPIHFGIIMAVNLSIGMYTPPFGLNLFASQAVFGTPLGRIYLGVLPFLLLNFATLMVITYVPSISMVLLNRYMTGSMEAVIPGRPYACAATTDAMMERPGL